MPCCAVLCCQGEVLFGDAEEYEGVKDAHRAAAVGGGSDDDEAAVAGGSSGDDVGVGSSDGSSEGDEEGDEDLDDERHRWG